MLRPTLLWFVLAALWVAFVGWYTSFAGPLSDEERAHYLEVIEAAPLTPEGKAAWRRFVETDTGDDFAMANVIHYRDEPEPVEGVEPGETTAEVMQRYMAPFLGRALRSAAHPVFLGQAASSPMDLWGIEGGEEWTTAALVRYRSRRDLLAMLEFLAESDLHRFKQAAIQKTIAFPIDPWFHPADPRVLLAGLFLIVGLANHLLHEKRRAA